MGIRGMKLSDVEGLPGVVIGPKTVFLPMGESVSSVGPFEHAIALKPSIFTIRIPSWSPVPLNQLLSKHWGKRGKIKNADAAIIGTYFLLSGTPVATGKRRVSIHVVWAAGKRMPDPDSLLKSTNDGLVKCGALKNDSAAWSEIGEVSFSRGNSLCTYLTLENIG